MPNARIQRAIFCIAMPCACFLVMLAEAERGQQTHAEPR
jgi:hypothetical protein